MSVVYCLLGYLSAIVTIVLFFWYYNYWKFERYLRRFPGPKPLPLVGNALPFSDTNKILPALSDFREIYGNLYRLYIGFEPNLIVCDHEGAEFFLSSNSIIDKSKTYTYLYGWLGTGLLTSTGEKWRKNRKIITPAFHFQILEQFVEIFNSAGDVMIEKLNREVGNASTDVYPYITLCALDIICESAMGTSVNAQDCKDSEYVRSVKLMTKIVIERTFSSIQQFTLLYYFTKNYRLERKALNVLHKYTNDVIKSRKLLIGNNNVDNHDVGSKRRMAFLDLLLQSTIDGQPLPDESIREEVDTFMFEGHDTTASGMSFALLCLANHPDIQKKAFGEQREIFSDDWGRPASYRDLQNMKYLDVVLKEVMRLYPSVPMIGRQTVTDVVYGDKVIPKGTVITLNIFGIHRNPVFFPDPLTFNPERFTIENTRGKNPYGYVPFSAGPRNCIGQKFATLEMKSTVSKVLRNFELLPTVPAHVPDLLSESVLKSANGIRLRLKKREL